MVMIGIVPTEKVMAEGPGVFDTTEPLGKLRPVFQSFELGLRIGVVIAHILRQAQQAGKGFW